MTKGHLRCYYEANERNSKSSTKDLEPISIPLNVVSESNSHMKIFKNTMNMLYSYIQD